MTVETAHVRWVGELPDPAPRADRACHELIAAVLRRAPGDWHALPDLPASRTAAIRYGAVRAYRPAGTFEAKFLDWVLYARYVGGGVRS